MCTKPLSIIFDMDGTLSDTAKATTEACNTIAAQMGLPSLTHAHVCHCIGYAAPEIYGHLLPGLPEEVVLAFGQRVEALESVLVQRLGPSILFDGVTALLEALLQRGIPMHIASTGSHSHVKTTLESSGIRQYFASVSCGQPAKVTMVREIIEGCPGYRWLMVGDKQKDAEAAGANHILSVGAAYGYCEPRDHHLFNNVVHSPAALLTLVDSFIRQEEWRSPCT